MHSDITTIYLKSKDFYLQKLELTKWRPASLNESTQNQTYT